MKTVNKTKQNLVSSSLILLVSTVLVKIIGACFKIPLATNTFLGDLGFGYFSVAYDLFTPFYTLAVSGLPSALSHLIAENLAQKRYGDIEKTVNVTKKLFIILGIFSAVIFTVFAVPFVKFTDSSGNTLYSIYAVIPSVFICFLLSVWRGYFEGYGNMTPTAVSKVIEAAGKLVLGLSFAFVTIKLTKNHALAAGSAMLGITVGGLVAVIFLFFKYKSSKNIITKTEILQNPSVLTTSETVKTVLLLALPMAVSSLLSGAVSVIDALSVRTLLNGNSENLSLIYKDAINSYNSNSTSALDISNLSTYLYGLRSKSFTLFNLLPTLTMSLGVSAMPTLSYYWSKKKIVDVKTNLNTLIKMLSLITFPAGMAYIAVSKPIMQLLYSDYGSVNIGGKLLFIFGFTAIFAGFAIPLTSVLQAVDCQFFALFNIVIGVCLKIILNIVLIPTDKFNIYGSAISTAVCYFVILFAHIIKIIKVTGKPQDFKTVVIKPFVAAVSSSFTAYIICRFSSGKTMIIFAVFCAVLVYFAIILALGIITEQDFKSLPKGEKLYFLAKKVKFIK